MNEGADIRTLVELANGVKAGNSFDALHDAFVRDGV